MSTKIQINSLEALERLIGNDNELEMEIRNSIVQEFTKKHLKVIANENVNRHISDFNRGIQDYARDLLGKYVNDPQASWRRTYIINNEVEQTIKAVSRNEAAKLINAEILKLIEAETNNAVEKIKALIDERVDHLTSAYIQEKVNERLQKIKDQLSNSDDWSENNSMRSGLH